MANPNKTLIVLVVDRSGSMSSIQKDAQGGINALIKAQAEAEGECLVTLVQFDTQYEFVFKANPAKGLPEYTLIPRGMTALLDATGRALAETQEYIASLAEDDRPGLVTFVIVTDGEENSSKEFTKDQVMAAIKARQDDDKWQFTYLGADASAFAVAQDLGLNVGTSAQYVADAHGVAAAYSSTSAKITRMRSASSRGLDALVANVYTDEERDAMLGNKS